MVKERDEKFERDLMTGLISLVLLAITKNAKKPMYGYQILKQIEEASSSQITLKQGTVYPVLRSMEKKGLLSSDIKASTSGPPRKYYKITKKGKKTLKLWTSTWEETRQFVADVLGGKMNA